MKPLILIAMLLIVGCGKEGTAPPLTQWDQVITSCGPGEQCPIYVKDGQAYKRNSDGSFTLLAGQ